MTDASRNHQAIPLVAFNSLLERVALIEATLRGQSITNNVTENHLLRSLKDRVEVLEALRELPTPDLASLEREIQSRTAAAVAAELETILDFIDREARQYNEGTSTRESLLHIADSLRARGKAVKP